MRHAHRSQCMPSFLLLIIVVIFSSEITDAQHLQHNYAISHSWMNVVSEKMIEVSEKIMGRMLQQKNQGKKMKRKKRKKPKRRKKKKDTVEVTSIVTPTTSPSQKPSNQPTTSPSQQPSSQPTTTNQSSTSPSQQPSNQPTTSPSSQPNTSPSSQPTTSPSWQPSSQPTTSPSQQPSSQPTTSPSQQPSSQPTTSPSSQPTTSPSNQPTTSPSWQPSSQPTTSPSWQPSSQPTTSNQPTTSPSQQPSSQPTTSPSSQPTTSPSRQPSSQPTTSPSRQPSSQPTTSPSQQPSSQPTTSSMPSLNPTAAPSQQPSLQPSSMPSQSPTTAPSQEPSLQPSSKPSQSPTISCMPTQESWKKESGDFDYDQSPRARFGPGIRVDNIIVENKRTEDIPDDTVTVHGFRNNQWANIRALDTAEAKYYKEFEDELPFSLSKNHCGTINGGRMQSPIDVWPTENATCHEHHQIRDKPGDFHIHDIEVKKQILPSKLRILYPRRTAPEPDIASADIPFGWGKQLDVIHIDMKFPSEHTLKGKRYPGEYQIYIMGERKRGAAVVSIFMDIDPVRELGNRYFQKAIDEFQLRNDADLSACNEYRKKKKLPGLRGDTLLEDIFNQRKNTIWKEEDDVLLNEMARERFNESASNRFRNLQTQKRKMQIKEGYNSSDPLTSPGRWDPWHNKHIMKSIWFYGYRGTLTEPPCTPFLEWRIIDTPMLLSKDQFVQLKSILFNHVDEKCNPTSVHYNSSVARPLQQNITGDVHRCTCHHFVSDELKAQGIQKCKKKFNYTVGIDMV